MFSWSKTTPPKQKFRIKEPKSKNASTFVSVNNGQAYGVSTVHDALKYLLFTPLHDVLHAGLTSRAGNKNNNSTNNSTFSEQEFWVRAKHACKYYNKRLVEYPAEYRRSVASALYAMYTGVHKKNVTFAFMLRVLSQNHAHNARSAETNILTSALVMTMQISEPGLSKICPKACVDMRVNRPSSAQTCEDIIDLVSSIDRGDNNIMRVFKRLYRVAYDCDLFA